MESNAFLKSINRTPTILFLSSSCIHTSVRCSINITSTLQHQMEDLAKAKPYSNLTKRYSLCTTEKHFIITKPKLTTLNTRNELYMPAPTKVHSKILLTDRISFSQRAHMLALKTLTFIYRANVSKVRKIFRTCND